LQLLTPRSRGPSVWAYTSSLGGGFVAGDQTELELRLGAGARCFLTSQSSTKIYRNPGLLPCRHTTRAWLAKGALLVFAPALVQPFADSFYSQKQEFCLAPGAGLALVDGFTSGRPARGERWAFGSFETRNRVVRGTAEASPGSNGATGPEGAESQEDLFLDALRLGSTDGSLAGDFRGGRFNYFATLLLTGAPVQEAAQAALAEVGQRPLTRRAELLVSASPVTDGVVLRLAGQELAPVETELRRHLARLNPQLGDDPWSRRW